MVSAEQLRSVLSDDWADLVIEGRDDGTAVVRDASATASANSAGRGFPVSETLYRCADLLADSGFTIALVRDEDGVYLNAH